ncbi:MAG: hypothetical protein KDB03_10205 [Planctomycetales bacterium]|nr:hypothetical protein [Planctomycetales bacterium]
MDKKSVADLYREAVHNAHSSAQDTSFQLASTGHLYPSEMIVKQDDGHGAPILTAREYWQQQDQTAELVETPEALDSRGEMSRNGDRITDSFLDMDIREALEILASTCQRQIVVDDMVGGVISVEFEDMPFEDALQRVLLPLGLVYVEKNDIYLVAPPDPESPLFRHVAVRSYYQPRNHLGSKLVELLPKRYQEFYQVSDERNLIVIDAPSEIVREISERLSELDLPVEQVVLEAIVCVTAPDSGFRFGMDWNHVVGLNNVENLNVGLSGLAFSGSASPYGLDNAFSDFAVTSAFVRLLSQEGYVTIRAAPQVRAKDGEKASISIARETFFSLQPTSSNVLFRQDVQKVDAGITLIITPRVRGDLISLEIEKAEVSEDIRSNDSRPELTSNPYPIINRRQVSTKVDVVDGHTIVIGGLIQRQTVDRVNQIPLLGDLPGVGPFFRTVEKQEQDAEVAIFISPRIVPQSELSLPMCEHSVVD